MDEYELEEFYYAALRGHIHFLNEFILDKEENYKPLLDDINYFLKNLNYVIEEAINIKSFEWASRLAYRHWQIFKIMIETAQRYYYDKDKSKGYPVNIYQDRCREVEHLNRDLQLIKVGIQKNHHKEQDYSDCKEFLDDYLISVKRVAKEMGKTEDFILKLINFKRSDI